MAVSLFKTFLFIIANGPFLNRKTGFKLAPRCDLLASQFKLYGSGHPKIRQHLLSSLNLTRTCFVAVLQFGKFYYVMLPVSQRSAIYMLGAKNDLAGVQSRKNALAQLCGLDVKSPNSSSNCISQKGPVSISAYLKLRKLQPKPIFYTSSRGLIYSGSKKIRANFGALKMPFRVSVLRDEAPNQRVGGSRPKVPNAPRREIE